MTNCDNATARIATAVSKSFSGDVATKFLVSMIKTSTAELKTRKKVLSRKKERYIFGSASASKNFSLKSE